MSISILQGDALAQLTTLPDNSVHCVVTSPPYYNLRNYSTEKWVGGDPDCDHQMPRNTNRHRSGDKQSTNQGSQPNLWNICGKCGATRSSSSWTGGDPACDHQGDQRYYSEKTAAIQSNAFAEAGPANAERLRRGRWRERGTCIHCEAVFTDQQIGLEETPQAYIDKLVAVFREVRRVLREDGTFWLNISDSYNNRRKIRQSSHRPGFNSWSDDEPWVDRAEKGGCRLSLSDGDIKEKDLIGIPWMLAFALRADGWYLRSDIIWHKNSVMPESVKDRVTRSYEHVFMLTKQPRYFFDSEAIAEASKDAYDDRKGRAKPEHKRAPTDQIAGMRPRKQLVNFGNNATDRRDTREYREPATGRIPSQDAKWTREDSPNGAESFRFIAPTRNSRDFWTINPKPFRDAHFATMPPALAEKCIKAGTSEYGCCPSCGSPYLRVMEVPKPPLDVYTKRNAPEDELVYNGSRIDGEWRGHGQKLQDWLEAHPKTTVGWNRSCDCGPAPPAPAIVLDPFGGAGTTSLAAQSLGRSSILIELNEDYILIAKKRLNLIDDGVIRFV